MKCENENYPRITIPLIHKINVDDLELISNIEKDHNFIVKSDEKIKIITKDSRLPFGENYFVWREMLNLVRHDKNAELWYYNDIQLLSGTAGYIIIRNGVTTGWRIVTRIS
jgi:hypothetical protein